MERFISYVGRTSASFQEEKMKTELPTMKQPLSEESQKALEQEAQENFQPLGVEEWQKLPK